MQWNTLTPLAIGPDLITAKTQPFLIKVDSYCFVSEEFNAQEAFNASSGNGAKGG
jgi:hypothetical protein